MLTKKLEAYSKISTFYTKKYSCAEQLQVKYEKLLSQCDEKDARIKELEHENKRLKYCLVKLRETVTDMIGDNKN